MNEIEKDLRAGMAAQRHHGRGAGGDRRGHQVVRALRLSRVARGVVRAARLRVGLPEGAPPGGVRVRAAQQLADGLLSPVDAGHRRRPPRRRVSPDRRHPLRLAVRRSRTAGARCGWGCATSPGCARRSASASRPSARAAPFASLADFAARTGADAAELASLAEIGAFAALGGTRREALWQVEALGRSGALFARRRARRRRDVAAARDERVGGDGGRLRRHRHVDRAAPGVVRARRAGSRGDHARRRAGAACPTAAARASPAS